MKKQIRNILSICLVVALVLTLVPVNVNAASKVKISKTKATIFIKKSTTLKVKGTKKKVTWTSSNKKVATVNKKGKVTAKKIGTTTITAKVSGKKYKCKVTVKMPYLNGKNLTLKKGETFTLKLTGATAKKFESRNTRVATVDSNGVITAIKEGGTTVIRCTDEYGRIHTCRVTVEKSPHIHAYTQTVTNPTCTEQGYTTYTCSCGTSYKDNYTDIIDHTWSEWTVTKEATDTENGTETRTCSMCSKTDTKDIAKTEHVHSYEKVQTVNPSLCGGMVYEEYKCACGREYTESYYASTKHEIAEWTITKDAGVEVHTKAEEFGERTGICSICGLEVKESIVNIDASNYETNKEAYAEDVVFVSDNVIQEYGVFKDPEEMDVSLGMLLRKQLKVKLSRDSGLEDLAKIRLAEIQALSSHERPNGNTLTYIADESVGDEIVVGENFIISNKEIQGILDEMVENPEQYANLVNENYTKYCGACFQTDNGYSWIILFY